MIPRLRTLLGVAAVSALLAFACLGAEAPAALADHTQVSMFQDDSNLVFCSTKVMNRTLARLESLGVEEVRINLEWANVAPDPKTYRAPRHFDANNPADYPAGAWAPYDRLVEAAPLYGMRVQFNVTSPGPLWAMGDHPPYPVAADHWYPNAQDYGDFIHALGVRYSGHYDGLPRVALWSLWNEPNQPGWLAPQWSNVNGHHVGVSPQIYRKLVADGWAALQATGHGSDQILVGETAAEGNDHGSFYNSMTPLLFLRDLYCVNSDYVPLQGESATKLGCAASDGRAVFAGQNPGLFKESGWAHHPYNFYHSPTTSLSDPNFVPLADIGRLGRALDAVFGAYGVHRTLPIYITEYGYQTNPPDTGEDITLNEQAEYLNESDYMAWENTRIRSIAQFLLFDAAPNLTFTPSEKGYWGTFQTGLLFHRGGIKPAYYAYRMPIFIPQPVFRAGQPVFVWGQVRPADQLRRQNVAITWQPAAGGAVRTIADVHTGSQGYLTASVRLPGSGTVRLAWDGTGATYNSRAVQVTLS